MAKEKHYYMIITSRGSPLLFNAQLPIFWKKKIAVKFAKYFFSETKDKWNVVKVSIIIS